MFGADDSLLNTFTEQLGSFKASLSSLYKQKVKIVAEREAARFQYLTGTKAQLQNILQAIYTQIFLNKNPEGDELARLVLSFVQRGLPMVSLSGGPIEGWANNIGSVGGRLGVGLLSPSDHYLKLPFNESNDEDQRPAYKIYGGAGGALFPTRELLSTSFLGYDVIPVTKVETGEKLALTIPISQEWVDNFLSGWHHENINLAGQTNYVNQLLTADYSAGNLVEAINSARAMIEKIIDLTQDMLRTQTQIDGVEQSLASFIKDFKQYLNDPNVKATLAELCAEAAKSGSDLIPATDICTVNLATSIEESIAKTAPVAPSTKKINWMLIAAAIAGVMMLKKGK